MTLSLFLQVLFTLSLLILTYYFLVLAVYAYIQFRSLLRLNRRMRVVRAGVRLDEESLTPVSVLVPAFNEGATILASITSLLEQEYPCLEVIVINDGSHDDTLQQLQTSYDLIPMELPPLTPLPCQSLQGAYRGRTETRLVVLDKLNGGKADALNAGLNAAHHPLVCCVDADSLLEPDAIRQMACLFSRRENTIAVGGMVRPMNGCTVRAGRVSGIQLPRTPLELVQVVEYLRAFLTSRFGWESMNSLLIVSGAFGMFDRAAVLEVGGYAPTIGEDAELTLRLHHHMLDTGRPYTIAMALDAVCWTQVPQDLRGLRTQRIRWQKGLADALWKHRSLLLNPRYGRVGMLALPFFWFSELLGPVIELLGYVLLLLAFILDVAAPQALVLFAMAYLHGVLQSVLAVTAEDRTTRLYPDGKSLQRLLLVCFVEPLVYRPLTVWWRCRALLTLWQKPTWGTIHRTEF